MSPAHGPYGEYPYGEYPDGEVPDGPDVQTVQTVLTLFVVLDILGLAGGIISTILSACTCSAICSPRTEAGTVRYTRAAVSDGRQ